MTKKHMSTARGDWEYCLGNKMKMPDSLICLLCLSPVGTHAECAFLFSTALGLLLADAFQF